MADLIPLTILGGYLGAGKTSWARHQLRHGAFGPRPHVLVNEAADTGVDHALLPGAVTLLAGACACCAGLPQLIAVLRDLCDHDPPGHVLLETSGLADPGPIARAIAADPILQRRYRLSEVITLVDACHGLDQLIQDARAQAQVAAAHRLILTKTESAPPATLSRLLATLARLTPVRVEAASLGQPRSLPPLPDPGPLPALSPEIARLVLVELDLPPMGWTRFALWLSALLHARAGTLVRIKGFLPEGKGAILLQSVRASVQPPELLDEAPETSGKVVLFGSDLSAEALARSISRFAAA